MYIVNNISPRRPLVRVAPVAGAVNVLADRAASPAEQNNHMLCLLLRHAVRFPAHSEARHLDAVAVVCVTEAVLAEGI